MFGFQHFRRVTALARWTVVSVCLCLLTGFASAQDFVCMVTAGSTPTVRSEGFTERVGDILITCRGGSALSTKPFGLNPIATADITVFLGSYVTNRTGFGGTTGGSDALLLIDEPGSTSVDTYGSHQPQILCPTPATGCTNEAATTAPDGSNVLSAGDHNVYQGIVSENSVTFKGVPILPPGTAGTRIFRITNLRVNVQALSTVGPSPTPVNSFISVSGSTALPIDNSEVVVGYVNSGLSTVLQYQGTPLQQCQSTGAAGVYAATLQYRANFGTAFQQRTATTISGFVPQNIPGNVYSNSESGFILPSLTSTSGFTAGLADFGTRLKAVFSNVPAGVTILVSTTNVTNSTTQADSTSPSYAVLVSGETTAENGGSPPALASTVTSGGINMTAVTPVNGTATAVWEVVDSNTNAIQAFQFLVNLAYTSGNNSPALGQASVSMSLAPNPTSGAFTASDAPFASSTLPIPRFADTSTAQTFATIAPCATVLPPALGVVTPTVIYGNAAPVTVRAGSGDVVATGSITLLVNSGTPITQNLTNGSTTFNLGNLATGTYPFVAVYNPGNFAAGSVTGVVTVIKANTTTALINSAGTLLAAVTAVAPGAGNPTGSIQFRSGSTTLATVALSGQSASFTPPLNTAVTAVYSGDSNFNSSSSIAVTVYPPPNSSLSISSSANPSTLGQSVTFTASILTSGGPPSAGQPTGAVQFFDGSSPLGSVNVSGGQATYTTSALKPGYHSIVAQYSGDTNWPSAEANSGQTVNAPITMTGSATPSSAPFGQTVTLTATVGTTTLPPGYAAPTGLVYFSLEGSTPFSPLTPLANAALASGTATITENFFSTGTHYVQAKYSGDGSWPSVSAEIEVTILPAPTNTSVSFILANGQPTLTSTVAAAVQGTGTPTGSVQFVDTLSHATVATATLSNGSAATAISAAALPGMLGRPIEAIYGGDGNFTGSTSAPLPVVVSGAGYLSNVIAPDEIASIFGVAGLSGDTPATQVGTALAGVSVNITDSAGNSRPAQLYGVFASAGQVNFIVPAGSAPGMAEAVVSLPGGATVTTLIEIAGSAPAIFTANMNGQGPYAGQIVYVQANGTQSIAPSGAMNGNAFVPAIVNLLSPGYQVYLILYGTGIRHAAFVSATVNGMAVPVAFFGAQSAYAGLDQINLGPLPANLAGAGVANIVITADGQQANPVTAAFQ